MYNDKLINDALSEYLEDTLNDNFLFIESLNDIILKNKVNLKVRKYDEKIDLDYSLSLAYSFFKTLSEEYASYFETRVYDGTILVSEDCLMSQSYYDKIDQARVILLKPTYTIEDTFVLVHEVLHDMNLNPQKNTFHRLLFTETISMLGERLAEDFLKENHICMKDNYKPQIHSLMSVYQMALYNRVDLELIKKFLSNGYVSIPDLKEILDSSGEDIFYDSTDCLISDSCPSVDFEQRYIIGELLSNYMYERIKHHPKYLCELLELNSIMNDFSFEDFLKYLDLDIEDNNFLTMSQESLNKLEKCYQKRLKTIYQKS